MNSTGVEMLFERNPINTIEDIQQKLRQDVDKKKDELRQIVGESYRDLIQVSDTIVGMKDKCDQVLNAVDQLARFCDQLSFNDFDHSLEEEENCLQTTISGQQLEQLQFDLKVKVLLNASSSIWSLLDQKEIIQATFYYLSTKKLCQSLSTHLPPNCLLRQHIYYLERLDNVLQQHLWSLVINQDSSEDEFVLDCFTCLLSIQKSSVADLFQQFLKQRQELLSKTLVNLQPTSLDIVQIVNIIISTLETCYKVFYTHSNQFRSALVGRAHELVDFRTEFHFLQPNESQLLQTITSVDQQQKTSSESFLGDISFEDVAEQSLRDEIGKWIQEAQEKLNLHCRPIFLQIEGQDLYKQLEHLNDYLQSCNVALDSRYEKLLQSRLDVWQQLTRQQFLLAFESLIERHVQKAFTVAQQNVDELLNSLHPVSATSTLDFVWLDDLSGSGELRKKAFGANQKTIEQCETFEKELENVLRVTRLPDLNQVVMLETEDRQWLQNQFQQSTTKHLEQLLTYVKQAFQTENYDKEIYLNVAHFLRMITYLCPSLRYEYRNTTITSSGQVSTACNWWSQRNQSLLETSYVGYRKYFETVLNEQLHRVEDELMTSSPIGLLSISMRWDEVSIEEQLEDGNHLSTIIRIPHSISLPLNNLLSTFAFQICKRCAHTLPKKLSNSLIETLLKRLAQIYGQVYDQRKASLPSALFCNEALQFYFDLQFLKNYLLIHCDANEIKTELLTSYNETIQNYESEIDPFDLHVFSPHLSSNLERNRNSISMLLTLMLSKEAHPSSSLANKSQQSNMSQSDANQMQPMRVHAVEQMFALLSIDRKSDSGPSSLRKSYPASMPSLTWMSS